jgi:YVTN family beta-propeller protein
MRPVFSAIVCGLVICCGGALAGQVPGPAAAPDIPVSHHDRVYAAEQFSNTVSVIDPVDNKLLGVIRLGDPQPANFSPLYKGQVLVHGMGFSPDHHTLAVVSIGSNSVTFIDTATNTVKHTSYVGRSPHEAFFTRDGSEVWVTVRGENYVSVLDGRTYLEKTRIVTAPGPGMTIFSPDGRYGYVCNSFNPELAVVEVKSHAIVARLPQPSPFCPDLAVSAEGDQLWYTLKDVGKTVVISAHAPYATLKVIDSGPITNHVNLVDNAHGRFAYVTVGGLNQVQVYSRDTFAKVATIPVGALPHGIWPSGDGTRIYAGLENGDAMAAIDTLTNRVIANVPIGQAAQAVTYVPDAVPDGDGRQNLQPLGIAGQAAHVSLAPVGSREPVTSVALFDQGLVQVMQAAVTGLAPKAPFVLALADHPDGTGKLEPVAAFVTNPAGAAIVNASGPIRQLARGDATAPRRYLTIAGGTPQRIGAVLQVQVPAQ